MLEQLLKELYETWGYTLEELEDIREKLQELGNSCYIQGCMDTLANTIYDKTILDNADKHSKMYP